MLVNRADSRPINVLVVGVGGQGVIMVSKVLAQLCLEQGYEVKQSEVHGMAKRGGSVFSHIRFGARVWSPTIPEGEADVLLAMEWAEGLRWLPSLEPERGIFIADTRRIVPPFAFRNRRRGADPAYITTRPDEVLDRVAGGYAIDATREAEALGNGRAANTVLLGALSTALGFPAEDWLAVISRFVPSKTIETNRQAFHRGRTVIEAGDLPDLSAPPAAPAAAAPVATATPATDRVTWRIEPSWCKGCNVCVTICPERCLALDQRKVAVLAAPDACTGCRLCEYLCPDLAITVSDGALSVAIEGAASPQPAAADPGSRR